jgi:metallo-beta-lactamase class B
MLIENSMSRYKSLCVPDAVFRGDPKIADHRIMVGVTKLLFSVCLSACAMLADEPFPAHHIIGNVYYVGSTEYASYLITTPKGNILINSSFESTVPWIRANIEKLGFKFQDTKILLNSHAHADHVAGNALVKKLTDAQTMIMEQDVAEVESGGKGDFQYNSTWPPSKVDRVLHDNDTVELGGSKLVAHLTPGHTRGNTTWTMDAVDGGKTYHVVIIGSPNVNKGYTIVNNKKYPEIAEDFERTFRVLKSLKCDVFLGAHGNYYGMAEKYARLQKSGSNPFIDPEGYRAYVNSKEKAFCDELAQQSKQ